MLLKVIFLLFSVVSLITANNCSNRTLENGIVCVCNSTYCDRVPTLANLATGEYQLYSTSKDKAGFTSSTASFLSNSSSRLTIEIDVNTTYQTILGFGGAFTDSTGENILSLPEEAQDKLLTSYFGEDGIAYSVCRVPVGGTDFSPRFYTYCDVEDPTLGNFSLQYEDLQYKENWIGTNLGPTLRNSSYRDLKLMVHDDVRILLPFVTPILENKTVLQYVDGVGVHWYTDFIAPAVLLDLAKSSEKDLFLLATEASQFGGQVKLGSWTRGVDYLKNILDDLEHDAVGWVDWNMALNPSGGPTYINNNLDSPIIVNATAGEFYKQPMYYVMGHFSKFILPGSVRLKTSLNLEENLLGIRAMAFLRPDNKIALVIYNSASSSKTFKVTIAGTTGEITVEPDSLTTVLYAK